MMLRRPFATLLTVAALCVANATVATAATITITNSDSGWYDTVGFHIPGNINYFSGDDGPTRHLRNFFVFDLSVAAGETITSAQLQLFTHDIIGSGLYTNYDVTTSVATLVAGTGGLAAYDDLGSGASFGSISLSSSQTNSLILIDLNAAAIAAINANGAGLFAIGGDLVGGSASAFRSSQVAPGNTLNQLILQTSAVPDPASSLSLLMIGIGGLVATRRWTRGI